MRWEKELEGEQVEGADVRGEYIRKEDEIEEDATKLSHEVRPELKVISRWRSRCEVY
jgi:hypothetical protein